MAEESALAAAVQQVRITEARAILFDDPAKIEQTEAELTQALTAYDKIRTEFQPLIEAGEEHDRFTQIDDAVQKYRAISDRVVSAARSNDDKTATALFLGEEREVFKTISSLFAADIAFNRQSGVAAADRARPSTIRR